MKEKFKELLEQSTNPPWDGELGAANEFNLEKFAELIVKECIDICLRNHINNIETISAGECAYDIQEHFGVE